MIKILTLGTPQGTVLRKKDLSYQKQQKLGQLLRFNDPGGVGCGGGCIMRQVPSLSVLWVKISALYIIYSSLRQGAF